jgi:hypothetical protein
MAEMFRLKKGMFSVGATRWVALVGMAYHAYHAYHAYLLPYSILL